MTRKERQEALAERYREYAENAARDTKDAIDILTRGRKYLKDKMLTIKVTVEFGDSSDFEDEEGGDE